MEWKATEWKQGRKARGPIWEGKLLWKNTMENHRERKRGKTQKWRAVGPPPQPPPSLKLILKGNQTKDQRSTAVLVPHLKEMQLLLLTSINAFSCLTWMHTKLTFFYKNIAYISTELLNKIQFSPSKWPTKITQFITSTRFPWKAFQKVARRRCTKKLIPKNKRNLQYCVTKLI